MQWKSDIVAPDFILPPPPPHQKNATEGEQYYTVLRFLKSLWKGATVSELEMQ